MSPSSTDPKLTTAKTIISTIGSVAAAAMVIRSVSRDYLPHELRNHIHHTIHNFIKKFSTELTLIFYEFEGFTDNQIYTAANTYLSARITSDVRRIKVTKTDKESLQLAMEIKEEYVDVYNGVKFTWSLVSKRNPSVEYHVHDEHGRTTKSNKRSFKLTFHKTYRELAFNSYIPYIITKSNEMKLTDKTVKLYTVERKTSYTRYPTQWTGVNLDHPATFETVAMDAGVKETVMKDLDRFLSRREYYRKVGKAWKRGYLLYGPPGTGKSSLIAAMANYLSFDIYDLELTNIHSNSELRRLLVATANRSILVVEDIDCSVELHDRVQVEKTRRSQPRGFVEEQPKVTLSGFLNFIDGLWSSCGDERIIIFTTNRKDKLDPALIRPGRMDVHIHMSYCTPSAFRMLTSNYLGITEHSLFEEVDGLMCQVDVTPAEVAEQLLKDEDPDVALAGLIEFFEVKRKEIEEAKRLREEEELAAKENEMKQQEDGINN